MTRDLSFAEVLEVYWCVGHELVQRASWKHIEIPTHDNCEEVSTGMRWGCIENNEECLGFIMSKGVIGQLIIEMNKDRNILKF